MLQFWVCWSGKLECIIYSALFASVNIVVVGVRPLTERSAINQVNVGTIICYTKQDEFRLGSDGESKHLVHHGGWAKVMAQCCICTIATAVLTVLARLHMRPTRDKDDDGWYLSTLLPACPNISAVLLVAAETWCHAVSHGLTWVSHIPSCCHCGYTDIISLTPPH